MKTKLFNLTSLVIDASRYQVSILPKELKSAGVQVAILKSSGGIYQDDRFDQHYAICQANEMPTPVYHWVDPIYTPERQIDFLLKITEGRNIPFFCLDVEQWWNAWASWYLAIAKKLTWSLVPKIKPDLISQHVYKCWQYLKAKTRKPVVIYTSWGFVRSYAPQMSEWLDESEFNWPAGYLDYTNKITCNWTDFRQNYLPAGANVLLPDGMKADTVRGWQFTGDTFSLPGMYANAAGTKCSPADVSLFDPIWLSSVLDGKFDTDPIIVKSTYTVSSWVWRGLNLRSSPNTASIVLKHLMTGTLLQETGNASGDWIEVIVAGVTGWVHSAYITKTI